MAQLDLFDQPPKKHPEFDGKTYEPEQDKERLTSAMARVYAFLSDGLWHTLREIAEAGKCSEAAASARIRDLRKPKFKERYPCQGVETQRAAGGLFVYRMQK